jgi:glycosyltransferase involved in cell wall biosynthesis
LHADVHGFGIAAGDLVIVPGLNVWYPEHNRELGEEVRAQGGRLVVVVHDFGPVTVAKYFPASYQAAFRDWIESLLPYASLFVADSEYTRREMSVATPHLHGRVECIVNPLAHEFPNEAPTGAGAELRSEVTELAKDYVLHVGRIEPRKNVAGLIKVWARLADELGPGLPLLMLAGRMNDPTSEVAAALETIGPAASRIRFLADLSPAELARLYAGCRFAVYPSFYEGWGLPVGEAACQGHGCLERSINTRGRGRSCGLFRSA